MPLHLDCFNVKKHEDVLAWLVQDRLNNFEDVFADATKTYLHFSVSLVDTITRTVVGAVVITVKRDEKEKVLQILDSDIVFRNPSSVTVNFLKRLAPSSEANEYYDADTQFGGRFQLETVNRYLIDGALEGKEQVVNLSAFPFELSVYDTMGALNASLGFAKPVKVGNTDMEVSGYGEDFVAPGSLLNTLAGEPDSDETFSFVIGKVTQVRSCCIELAGEKCDFLLVQLDTGMGNLTTAVNPERFDASNLATGKFVSMFADIKADFKLTDTYPKSDMKVGAPPKKKGFFQKLKELFH